MANSIAEMLIGSALQTSQAAPDISGSIVKGAALGEHIAAVQAQRAAVEKAKQDQEQAKLDKVGAMFEAASKMGEGRDKSAFVQEYIPRAISAMGLSDRFDPVSLKMLQGNPALASRLQSDIRAGKASMSMLNNPDELATYASKQNLDAGEIAKTVDAFRGALDEADKFALSEEGKSARASQMAQAQLGKQIQGQQAAPEVEYKKKLSDIAANFNTSGGMAGVEKNVAKIQGVIDKLKNKEIKFGTVAKSLPYGSSEEVLSRIDPKAKAAIDDVRGAVNLRAALADPNPTEKQINAIMSRSIDPRLSNADNIKKLEDAITELQQAATDRNAEFRNAGLLPRETKAAKKAGGSAPKAPPPAELTSRAADFAKVPKADQPRVLDALSKRFNMSMDEVRKALGVK